jgi:CBS domain-containing protein
MLEASEWTVWLVVLGIVVLVGGVYLAVGRGGRDLLDRRTLGRALRIRVGDVMSRPVVVAREETTVEQAAAIMLSRRIGCLPVVGGDGRLVGIVTESDLTGVRPRLRDLVRARAIGDRVRAEGVEHAYDQVRAMTVAEVMTRAVVTAAEDEPLSDILVRMMDRDLHHLPVTDGGVPVGIVARHDLLSLLARSRSRGRSAIRGGGPGREAVKPPEIPGMGAFDPPPGMGRESLPPRQGWRGLESIILSARMSARTLLSRHP